MPDFKDLNPIISPDKVTLPFGVNVAPAKKPAYSPFEFESGDLAQEGDIFSKLKNASDTSASRGYGSKGVFVSNAELDANRRYGVYNPTVSNPEDYAAYGQSNLKSAANGLLKGVNLAGTTFVGGFGMLYGAAKSVATGRLADIWDNEPLNALDAWNNKVDNEYLPNYYTDAEKNSEWYSTQNWFKTNFLFDKLIKNSGFAVGAMLSGNLANAGLGATGKIIGTLAGDLAATAESAEAFKLFTPALRNTARAFSTGKNIEAAQILESRISSIVDLEAKSSALADIAKQTSDFAKIGDLGRRTAIAVYSSAGESTFEALQTSKEYRQHLINDYIAKNGSEPTGEVLKNINESSESVGAVSFLGNMALLSATEYAQLPYLMGSSYSASKQAANSLVGKVDDVLLKEGKYIADVPTSRLGKIATGSTKYGGYAFDPKEGFQEVSQYALQIGTENYYNKKFNSQDADAWVDGFLYGWGGKDAQGNKIGALNSKEGIESGILGGITGGGMQAIAKIGEGTRTRTNTQEFLNKLNGSPSFKAAFKDKMSSINRGVALQQEQEKAVIDGNKLDSTDLKADMLHNYLSTRIKYGRYDMVEADLEEMKHEGSTDKGLAALKQQGYANVNDTVASFSARINEIQEAGKSLNSLYKGINMQYGGLVDKEGKKLFTPEVIDKMTYAAFKVADYDKRIPQVSKALLLAGLDLQTSLNKIIASPATEKAERDSLNSQIDSIENIVDKTAIKQELSDVIDMTKRRKQFLAEYNTIKSTPQNFRDVEIKAPKEGEPAKVISIKTKKGIKDVEIGTPYILGRVEDKDEKGNIVYRAPEITILGENADGTLKVQDSTGKIHDLAKSKIEKFNLAKVSDVVGNKTANFYRNHWNTVYNFNFGKGRKRPGRLVYNPETNVLAFRYNDETGKTKEIRVTNKHFQSQPGFTNPILTPIGELTAAQKQSEADFLAQKAEEEKDEREGLVNMIADVYQETLTKLENNKAELEEQQKRLNKAKEEISNAFITKKGTVRQNVNTAQKIVRTASAIKEAAEARILQLQADKEDLEMMLPYLEQFVTNEDIAATKSDFVGELKTNITDLEAFIEATDKDIKTNKTLLATAEEALKEALSLFNDLIKRLKEENPNIPLSIDELQDQVERFLGEEGAKQYIAEKAGFTEQTLVLQEQLAEFKEDLKMPNLEKQARDLNEAIAKMDKALTDAIEEQIAKGAILDALKDYIEKEKIQKDQIAKLANDKALLQKYLGTHTKDVENNTDEKPYQPEKKKTNDGVINGTIGNDNGREHQKRANIFGINLPTFKNREKLRAIEVTAKTEGKANIPGLIDRLIGDFNIKAEETGKTKIDPNSVVAVVFVQDEGEGKFSYVNENGEVVAAKTESESDNTYGQRLLDSAIYQVRPREALVQDYSAKQDGSDKQTMFRDTTPKDVQEELKAKYAADRARVLASEQLEPMKEFNGSFGIVQYEQKSNDKGELVDNFGAKNDVESTGLVTEGDLSEKAMVEVATTNDPSPENGITFKNALGRVFLRLKGIGLIKLNNNKLGRNRAEIIFSVIEQVAKNVNESTEDGIKNSSNLFNWLSSVIHWGIPRNLQTDERKEPSYNSVWFEKIDDENRLFISGKGQSFLFTPATLATNKDRIITLLENMYHNTSSSQVKKGLVEYHEITGINKEGKPIVKTWDNYQTYLLSKEDRKEDEIPLITPILAIKGTPKQNRKGIYFVLQNNLESEIAQKKAPAPKEEKKKEAPKEEKGVKSVTLPNNKGVIPYIQTEDGKISFPADDKGNIKDAATVKLIEEIAAKIGGDVKAAQEKVASIVATIAGKEVPKAPASVETKIFSKEGTAKKNRSVTRLQWAEQINKFEGENWKSVEDWLKKVFPNIPVYRVKNAIQATNGRQAWGMFHQGAIYLSQNAQNGTAYHEVFEAVWHMFTDSKEQEAILNEFKGRKGSFTNRFTGESTKYSEATPEDAKEEIAEEFRDYVLYKKIPAKPASGKPWIVKLFSDLVDFFKKFFTGDDAISNTEKLFEKIGNGYYQTYIPYETNLSLAKKGIQDIDNVQGDEISAFRLDGVPYVQKHEVMQQLIYSTLADLVNDNKSLFGVNDINKKDLYERLKKEILSVDPENPGVLQDRFTDLEKIRDGGKITQEAYNRELQKLETLYNALSTQWESLVDEHTIYLKQYSIEFDENDDLVINNDEKTKESEYGDSRKVDTFRKANPAIKLLLSTIPQVIYVDGAYEYKPNSIGGVSTLPLDRTFITLKNKLYNSLDVADMMNKLRDLTKTDPNYRALYTRLTKNSPEADSIDWTKITNEYEIALLSAFYKAMKAQNAEVKIMNVLPSGEVVIGNAHLSDAARQAKSDMFNDVVATLKGGHPYIEYDKAKKEYNSSKKVRDLNLPAGNREAFVAFLKEIGIDFTIKEVKAMKGNYTKFESAVNGIKSGISSINGVKDLNKYSIDLEGRLTELGEIRAMISNPDFESTYFNINGERTQTYIGTNAVSDLYTALSNIKNIQEISDTPYAYLLTDAFAQNSAVLNAMFNPKTGNRREGKEDLLTVGIIEGMIDQAKGKSKESSNITAKDRLIMELNLNSRGWFLNLVPGDASIEWMVKMHDENAPFVSDIEGSEFVGNPMINLLKNYLIAEINTSRENRTIVDIKGRKSSDLRFFKAILDKETHDKIVKNTSKSAEELYQDNKKAIDEAIFKFVENKAKETLDHLKSFGVVEYGEEGFEVENLAFAENVTSEEQLLSKLIALEANFQIANMEMHKLIYSDPYFYKDELKRIKNFNSPAQSLMSSKEVNDAIHKVYNNGFKKGTNGWYNFTKDYLVSSVTNDIKSFIPGMPKYEGWDETDGGGVITQQAYRNIRIRSANWNEEEEKQYRHDMAYEDLVKSGASKEEIEKFEKKNPGVKSAYTPIKPIVRGSKEDGHSYNDVVLDKFALVPFSFRILHKINSTSNAIRHYDKMIKEGVDYTVYKSGRKVGATAATPLYNAEGAYNKEPFASTNNIPLSIISIQSEVPSKDKAEVTQGSQVTKLATMDFMDAGVPLDFDATNKLETRFAAWIKLTDTQKEKASPIYKLIRNNEVILEERIRHGYDTLLNRLGIEKKDKRFIIKDKDKLIDTLTSEIYKREVNENIILAFKGFKSGQVVLEATPAYQQIRNILYSIANKQVTRSTLSGGLKVQIPSSLLESVRAKEVNGKYASDYLEFYDLIEDGKKVRVAEIMVGRWFKSDKTDEELLKYLNTAEGQKLLSGVAFRIPTQKQNSIDVFKVKKLLPKEFGDSVVIPSALVNKVGSDFDIDKLSIYLKNVYRDLKNNEKIVPFFGYGQQAKDQLAKMYDDGAFLTDEQRKKADKWIKNRKIEDKDEAVKSLINGIFGDTAYDESYEYEVIDDLLDVENKEEMKARIVNQKYKESLENEYIQSLEDLVSHPSNYDKLISPNSAQQLKDLSDKIVGKLGKKTIDYTSVGNMLDRNFMENLRQSFVRGKYAIGIAATAQTNNAQNQRSAITIDIDKLKTQSIDDKVWLGDGFIKFKEFNKIGGKPTLSLSKNAEGQLISDIIGQFIDGYVDISKGPWIMELGATPNTAGTWLFLIKLGVPIDTVAYFMNQPIIRDYLKNLDDSGYSYLFNKTLARDIDEAYTSGAVEIDKTTLPSSTALGKMVGRKGDLSNEEKAIQGFIFEEFLKYAKLAEQMFYVQQGSNFDTASINDPYIVFKKIMQLERARKTMISSVDDLLKNSFVGELKNKIYDIRDAFSTILISDKPGNIRNVIEEVLKPYVDMSDRDFVKISQKVVNDLFDWAVQTNQDFNQIIKPILLGGESTKSAAEEIMKFVKSVGEDHPLAGNYIIKSIKQYRDSVKENSPQNLYITGKNNKTYDQNNVIYGFNEIKTYLQNQGNLALYTKLVQLSVLQSGLSNSKISFTHLLPYEDFKDIYNQTLVKLDGISNLQEFAKLNVLERNNWNNPDVVVAKKSKWIKLAKPFIDFRTGFPKKWIKVPEIDLLDKTLKNAVSNKKLPQLIQISPNTREGKEEFLNFSWELDLSKEEKKKRRKKGDYSYIKRGLFQKVYDPTTNQPLITTYTNKKGVTRENYVYKAVNAWGDSFRANEFYSTPEQSVIDNGFIKVKEVDDRVIYDIYIKATPVTKKEDESNSNMPECA